MTMVTLQAEAEAAVEVMVQGVAAAEGALMA